MNVSEITRKAYESSDNKNLAIYIPDLDKTLENNQIHYESMNLEEALLDGVNVEFIGCVSSIFEIQISGVNNNIKGKYIEVSIQADDTEEIPLFHGTIDSVESQSNRNYKKITAYDELYTKGNINVADWYNDLQFPISLKDFRNSFFSYIGIEQEENELPNDDVVIDKEYEPVTLLARTVFKSICQINGAFGIINRYGKFEYRILKEPKGIRGAFPGPTLYPPFYPGVVYDGAGKRIDVKDVAYYKKVDYEEYSVKPVEKVTIRQSDNEAGVTYGKGSNNYIIQGNMFTMNLPEETILTMAKRIHENIADIEYVPFVSENSGYPYVEVGLDAVSYFAYDFEASEASGTDVYQKKTFQIFKRTLSGIQALKDSYEAEGEEYQKEFITDVGVQLELLKTNLPVQIKNEVRNYTYSKEEVNEKMVQVVSVAKLPENPLPNTIYLIQGEVVVE